MNNSVSAQKIAVVTGASRGIGYALALALAAQNYHIIALARTIGALEELDDSIQHTGGSATLVPIDITDTKALQALGPNLVTRFKHIDLVVGAAGYLSKLTSIAQGPMDHWTRALATNTTANFVLLQTLHPLLKQAQNPCALFLTSNPEYHGRAYWGMYAASKAALNAMVASYNAENPSIDAFTYAPVATRTRLRDEAYPGNPQGQSPEQTANDIMSILQNRLKKAA